MSRRDLNSVNTDKDLLLCLILILFRLPADALIMNVCESCSSALLVSAVKLRTPRVRKRSRRSTSDDTNHMCNPRVVRSSKREQSLVVFCPRVTLFHLLWKTSGKSHHITSKDMNHPPTTRSMFSKFEEPFERWQEKLLPEFKRLKSPGLRFSIHQLQA